MKGLFSRVGPKEFLREFWALGMVKVVSDDSMMSWPMSVLLTRLQTLTGPSRGPLFLLVHV